MSYGNTHIGMRRKVNEDSFLVDESQELWIVADGMGGHAAGDVASKLACQNVSELIKSGCQAEDAIGRVHQQIRKAGEEDIGQYQMGTTLVLAKLTQSHLDIFWVGDSRAYLMRENRFEQVTKDHSLVQKMIDNHLINEQEAKKHPKRNVISQCLGAANIDALDVGNTQILMRAGDRVILCSDGLHGELEAEHIESILSDAEAPKDAVEQLILSANQSGGADNITVIAIFTDEV